MLCFINKLKQDAGTPLVNGTYKNHASHLQSQSPTLNRNTKNLAKYTTLTLPIKQSIHSFKGCGIAQIGKYLIINFVL